MTNTKIYYIPPRKERAQKRPFRLPNGGAAGGEAALLAGVIGTAQNDFIAGNDEQYFKARAYFMSDTYRHHAGLLGLPPGQFPEGITAIGVKHDY